MKRNKNRTETEIFQVGFLKPFLQASDRPFIKQLNWFTGFGKTYTAAVFAIDLFVKADVIPVFIAPLQSLVKGFSDDVQKHNVARDRADEIEALLLERGAGVPVHRLYSRDYHQNDRTFFDAVIKLHDWLVGNAAVFAALERNDRGDAKNSFAARVADMRRKSRVCLESSFHDLAPSDDTYADAHAAYLKSASRALSLADSITRRLVALDVDNRTSNPTALRIMTAPSVADMVRRLQPLQVFLDDPGIIVSTASKSQVQQQVYAYDSKAGKNRWITFESLPEFLKDLNKDDSALGRMVSKRPDSARVVMFVDEEEDSYWYLFDQRKSVVNSEGRNDLNVVITEFFTFLDLRWPISFEKPGADYSLAHKVFFHLERIAAVSQAVWREFELEKTAARAKHLPDARRVEIFRREFENANPALIGKWTDGELLEVLKQLIDRNDVHNQFQRFQEKARVLAGLREYVSTLDPVALGDSYSTYRVLRELVVEKKYFTMSRASYGEVLDQPGQTFFNGESSVMATDFLKRIQLTPDTGDQTIRLVYHEDELPQGAYTLFNYLELVLFIAQVLKVESGDAAITFSKDDLERYSGLARFRRDVRSLFKKKNVEGGFEQDTFDDELLTENFFFSGTKSVVTLEESWRQADEYNLPADVNLTVTITSLRDTPEEDLLQALGRSNGIYLMSATGGLAAASTGAFNTKQLQRMLEAKGGVYGEMTEEELVVVGKRANDYLALREREVAIVDDTAPASGFDVSGGYKGLKQLFHEAIPKKQEVGYLHLNSYKKHEIDGLVASLDKLLATEVRSGLALCQTIRRVQKCLVNLARTEGSGIEQLDNDGHHFVVKPVLPFYRKTGSTDPVTLILYTAERFRKRDSTKTGAVSEADDSGQFNQELVDALNITNHKVLLWTAYGSASRGLDFITTERGEKKDFELFCLLNDPYYTRHTRPGSRGFSMEMFQSYLQVVRDDVEEWPAMSKRDLLYEYSRNRWKRLRKEHFIDITRTVFQALGRGERVPEAKMPKQRIVISAQASQMVHLGVGYVPELAKRASPAQRKALEAIEAHNRVAAVFPNEDMRKTHAADSLKRALLFREYTSQTPKHFRSSPVARQSWPWLFNTRMFMDPEAYRVELGKRGIPSEFIDGTYLQVPGNAELFTKEVSRAGVTESIITDYVDGTDVYDWVGMLAPAGLADKMSPDSQKFMKARHGFPVETAEGLMRLYPQPWFVTEIMKGYIAELEFERFVEDQFRVLPTQLETTGKLLRYLNVEEHPLCADLFQLYDYYLEPTNGNSLVAIDVKNWARITDRLQKDELEAEARNKHERLRALFPDRTVHAVYVNLRGAHKHQVERPPTGSIRFMSLFVCPSDEWVHNDNLVNALLGQ